MTNLLLEQYARYKKTALERSPYSCLLNADIQLNPHQINAFCAALQALKTGGIFLPMKSVLVKQSKLVLCSNM